MKQIANGKLAQVAGRYAEHSPTATACCMTCRTCVTSNLVALAAVPVVAVWAVIRRWARRPRAESQATSR